MTKKHPRAPWWMSKAELIKAIEDHLGLEATEVEPIIDWHPAWEDPPTDQWDAAIEFRSPTGVALMRFYLGDRSDGTWFIGRRDTPAVDKVPDGIDPTDPGDYLDGEVI